MNKTKLGGLPLFVVLSLAMCAAPLRAQDMQAAISAPPVQTAAASSATITLTLQQAVKLALANSPQVRLARAQYDVAVHEAGVDRASFLPNLYTGSGAVYTYGFPSIPGSGPPAVFELDFSESLFNPAVKAQQHAKEEMAKSRDVEYQKTHDDVMVHAALDYLELAKVRHSLDLVRAEQSSARKVLEVTREQVAANQALPIEETRVQLTLAKLGYQTVKLQDRDEALSEEVRNLAGIPAGRALVLGDEQPDFSNDLSESDAVSLGLKNDPALREAENERDARRKLLHGARMSYWPTVDLIGEYARYSRLNNYDEFYKTFIPNSVNAGVEVTIPLFAAKASANVALARSNLNAAELALSSQRRQTDAALEDKYRAARELESSADVARLDLQFAQQSLQLAQDRLQHGQATIAEVEQGQIAENQKWLAYLDANFALQQAQLALLEATGQLAKVFP